jgi:hypothetical protein
MRVRIAILVLAYVAIWQPTGRAQGVRPVQSGRTHISALRDWRFWTGEAVIAASQILDGASTCKAFHYGAVESSPLDRGSRSCRTASLGLSGAFAFDTALNLLQHKWFVDGNGGVLDTVIAFSVPAAVAPIHFQAAAHNYHLIRTDELAAARARLE